MLIQENHCIYTGVTPYGGHWVQKLREGFRPKTAQHRGGQTPRTEPAVNIELFRKQADDYTYQWLPFSQQPVVFEVDEAPLTEDQPLDVSSSSDAPSQSDSDDDQNQTAILTDKSQLGAESCDEFFLAEHRRVTHAMILSSSSDLNVPKYMDKSWRPACGTHMVHSEAIFLDEWNTNLSFCQHPGCKKAWSAMGMF